MMPNIAPMSLADGFRTLADAFRILSDSFRMLSDAFRMLLDCSVKASYRLEGF